MRVNELRVGNYVKTKHQTKYIINSITKGGGWIELTDGFELCDSDIDSIEPLTLTEELLLKCGFERFEFDNGQPNQYRLKNRLIVIRDNIFIDYGSGVKIYSLHQLQNLIHALTNEELTINL